MKRTTVLYCLLATISVLFISVQSSAQKSLNYDGVDDYVTLPGGVANSLSGDYTIEAWVYWRGAAGSAWQRIFDFGNNTTTNMFLTTNAGAGPRFAITTAGGGNEQRLSAAAPLTLNTWHHIAVVIVHNTNTGTLYIDGAVAATNTAMTLRPSVLGATTKNYFGKSQYADPYFNGYIDEVRISNSARYLSAFTPQRTNFSVDANTTALYHFDEASGQTVLDATGNFSGLLGATSSVETVDPSRGNLSILPVTFQEFRATKRGADVKLDWRTANEQGNKGFHIERSVNGAGFSPVGFVTGGAASTGTYSFTDAGVPAGTVLYRLKQEDNSGRILYSPVVNVAMGEQRQKLIWSVTGQNAVSIRLSEGGNENFAVTDMSGRTVLKGNLSAGNAWLSLPSGVYTVSVRLQDNRMLSTTIQL